MELRSLLPVLLAWLQCSCGWNEVLNQGSLSANSDHPLCVSKLRSSEWRCTENGESCPYSCQEGVNEAAPEREAVLAVLRKMRGTSEMPERASQRLCTFPGVECDGDKLGPGGWIETTNGSVTGLRFGSAKSFGSRVKWGAAAWMLTKRNDSYTDMSTVTTAELNNTAIPWAELAKVPGLRRLLLPSANMTGTLDGIESLTAIEDVRIKGNLLSGTLPKAISGTLTQFEVSGNRISGTISPELMTVGLQTLRARKNQLSGTVPWNMIACGLASPNGCSDIEVLDLETNQLSGSILPAIGTAKSLAVILISNNRFSGQIPWDSLSRLARLTTLSLSHNPFEPGYQGTGYDVSHSQCLYDTCFPQLSDLSASNVSLRAIPRAVEFMPKLWILNLMRNQMAGSVPYQILVHRKLQILLLGENKLDSMPTLTEISAKMQVASDAWEESSAPNRQQLAQFSTLPQNLPLSLLALHSNNLDGDLDFLRPYSKLKAAWLNDNRFSGSLPSFIGTLTALSQLVSASNELSGTIPTELINANSLQVLVLSKNKLEGTVGSYKVWPQLKHLNLAYNKLSGTVVVDSHTLETLDLSHNQFDGQLRSPLCPSLNFLSVNKNSLNSIALNPSEGIGNCYNLSNLLFMDNQLNTHVPEQLNNLTKLRTVFFAGNKLSCKLPMMENATNLGEGEYVDAFVTAMNEGIISVSRDLEEMCKWYADDNCASIVQEMRKLIRPVDKLKSTVHVLPGNSFSPNIEKQDIVKQRETVSKLATLDTTKEGQQDYFPSDSQFWAFVLYQIPIATFLYLLTLTLRAVSETWKGEDKEFLTVFWVHIDVISFHWQKEPVLQVRLLNRLLWPTAVISMVGCLLLGPFYFFQEGMLECPYLFTRITSAYVTNVPIVSSFFRPFIMCLFALLFHMQMVYCFWLSIGFLLDAEKNNVKNGHRTAIKMLRKHLSGRESVEALQHWQRNAFGFCLDDPEEHSKKVQDLLLFGSDGTAKRAQTDHDHGFELREYRKSKQIKRPKRQPETEFILYRWLISKLLLLLLICVFAAPSGFYVLSSNVPHAGLTSWISNETFWSVVGNALVCAAITSAIDALIVPPVARLLVYIEGEYNNNTEIPTLIQKGKAELTMMVNMSFVLSIIVPIVLVVTLDHSCFRYYIKFAPDLETLLDSWDSAQTGFDAYRKGFCTRRLIEMYGSVWAARLLMMIVTGPILQYLKSSHTVQRVMTSGFQRLGFTELASDIFARDVDHIQEDLAITYQMIGILVTFGLHVPVLTILCLFFLLTNTIAVVYVVNLKLNTQASNMSEMLLVRYPAAPLIFFIFVGYAFAHWYFWDNDLDFALVVYCWPLVFIVGAFCMLLRSNFQSTTIDVITEEELIEEEEQERNKELKFKSDTGPDAQESPNSKSAETSPSRRLPGLIYAPVESQDPDAFRAAILPDVSSEPVDLKQSTYSESDRLLGAGEDEAPLYHPEPPDQLAPLYYPEPVGVEDSGDNDVLVSTAAPETDHEEGKEDRPPI